jgi:PKD repeat protein
MSHKIFNPKNGKKYSMDVSQLPSGMYFIHTTKIDDTIKRELPFIRNIATVLILSLSLVSLGQENNVWHFVEEPSLSDVGEELLLTTYSLDFNHSPPQISILGDTADYRRSIGRTGNSIQCDKQGKLSYFTLGNSLFAKKQALLLRDEFGNCAGKFTEFVGYSTNSDTLYTLVIDPLAFYESSSIYSDSGGSSIWVKVYSLETGELFSKNKLLNGRFEYNYWDVLNGSSPCKSSGSIISIFGRYYTIDSTYWLAVPHHDSLTLCKLDAHFNVLKTVSLKKNFHFNDNTKVVFSNDGKKIAINGLYDVDSITSWRNRYRERKATGNNIFIYDFDPISGSITNKKELVYPKVDGYMDFNVSGQPDYRYYFRGLEFSPNDSFLYTVEVDTKPDPDEYYYRQLATWDSSVNYRTPIHYKPLTYSDLKLGPDGKVYIASRFQGRYYLDVIHKPNFRGEQMELARDDILINIMNHNWFGSFFRWPNTLGVYKRVSFSAKPKCKGLAYSFTNTSDTSHFSHYRFYLGNGDSIDIPSNTALQTVSYTYPQPGKYLVHLRAFNSVGGWVYTRDSITVTAPPVAKLAVQDTVGCQWLAFTYADSSVVNPYNTNYYTRLWQFNGVNGIEQERDTVFFGENSPTKHKVFNQDGVYTTTLFVNNGYCTDTAVLEQDITILPAPQPGIAVSDTAGCSPLTINFSGLHTDVVDSVVWQLGTKRWLTTDLSNIIKDTVLEAGSYQLTQANYGPTGCVTADTVAIEVLEGFPLGYKPVLHTATFLEKSSDSVGVFWQFAPNAKTYQLLLNGNAVTSTQDTFYTLARPNLPATFRVEAENICNETAESNVGKLMQLTASRTEDNTAAVIQFTSYEQWAAGVSSYTIERLENGSFISIGSLSNATSFTDTDFAKGTDVNQCYRIKATQQNGSWYSYSNTVCVPLAPIVWVPTAFTPNHDGLNDAFSLVAQGAKTIEYCIYNRWGELIYTGNHWDGANAPIGVYQYNAIVEFENGQRTFLNGTVSLVR